MTPATIRFTAKPSNRGGCKGCIFIDAKSETCRAACDEAIRRGLPDCDDSEGYIYVEDVTDPRQMSLEGA